MPRMVPHDYHRNIPLFIAFRVFFNARFYYPVLGVLFLDLGLSLEQYAILNAVWAVTIIVLEVPSGAMADLIGRKRMVVAAGFLMILEMLILGFAPAGPLLFWFLVGNRILSGFAEACASGADEALTYDSLPDADREHQWPAVLARLMRWSSATFFVAMLLGAAVFDAEFMNRVASFFGASSDLKAEETVRWPVLLTLGTSFLATACALLMREPPRARHEARATLSDAVTNILTAARFVFSTRKILILLAAGVLFDSVVRLFLTFASNYYRLIDLPPSVNGVLGSAFAVLGFFAAGLARRMAARCHPVTVALIVGTTLTIGLFGLCLATPVWGVWVVIPIGLVMPFTQFFLSNYLNAWTSSELRATVLSFRGMALNLGYGAAGLGFATLTSAIRSQSPALSSDELFGRTLFILPAAFLSGCVVLALAAGALGRASGPFRRS